MVNKARIKGSEARILLYLSVAHDTRKYPRAMANALEMDYGYLLHVLNPMVSKKWLSKQQNRRYVFYTLTSESPLELAKTLYNNEEEQLRLQNNYSMEEKPILNPDVVEANPNTIEDTYNNDNWENRRD
jgi:DNA-binding MarR family transcriptional regulator